MKKMPTPHFTRNDVELLNQQVAYQGYFRIKRYTLRHRLFGGGWSPALMREVFDKKMAVGILLFDPVLNKVILIEQFRAAILERTHNPWLIELVAGIMDTDESPEQVAIREAKEEAGLLATDLIPIYEYWTSPGGSSEKVKLFCGRVDASQAGGIHGLEEEGEDIRVWSLDTHEAYTAVAEGRIQNAFTIVAIQWLQLNETKVKNQWLK